MAELRAFLVAADELHFGRAAERLRVSPSRVSQLVRCLETRVGASLFERTTRRVELTPIGAHLHADLTRVYDDLNTSMRRAQSAAKGLTGQVKVGYLTHCQDAGFTRLVADFQCSFPACEVGTIDVTGTDYHDVLRNGSVDVLLGRFGTEPPPSGLVQGPVMSSEDWVLGVACSHPLAARDVVSVEELADHAIFGVPDSFTGELVNPLYPVRTPKGRPIPRRGIARTFAEVLAPGRPARERLPGRGVISRPLRPPGGRVRPAARLAACDPHGALARARQHRAGNRLPRQRDGRAVTGPAPAWQSRLRRLARPQGPRPSPLAAASGS